MLQYLSARGFEIDFLEALNELLGEKLRTRFTGMNTFFDAQYPARLTIFGKVTLGNILCQEKATIFQG